MSSASQTRSSPTVARPLPLPTLPLRRTISTSILSTSPGTTCLRNLTPSIPAKSASLSAVLPAGHDADGPDLGHRLDDEDAGHDRIVGEVALEEGLVLGDVLYRRRPAPQASSSSILSTSRKG